MDDFNSRYLEFCTPLVNALKEVYTTMANSEIRPDKPLLTRSPINDAFYSAIIALTGKYHSPDGPIPFSGTMSLTWNEKSYLALASAMLMEEFEEFEEDIKDMGMEIANMTVGGAKKILRPKGFEIEMSIPTCVVGNLHRLDVRKGVVTIGVPMNGEHGQMMLELNYLEFTKEDLEAA